MIQRLSKNYSRRLGNKMNNELIFGVMAIFGSIFAGLQLWQIKRISDLCERVTRMETEIEHHFNGKHKREIA